MKLFITVFLLCTGLNQILARYVPWTRYGPFSLNDFIDEENELFGMSLYPQVEDRSYTFKFDENESEESKELVKPAANSEEPDQLDDFFDAFLLHPFVGISDGDTNSNEKTQNDSQEQRENSDGEQGWTAGERSKSSEETTKVELNKDKSSEEQIYWKPWESQEKSDKSSEKEVFSKDDKSQENSDEKLPNMEVEIFDLTKSSEEDKPNKDDKSQKTSNEEVHITDIKNSSEEKGPEANPGLSEKDLNELVSLYFTLRFMDNIIASQAEKKEFEKVAETDLILAAIGLALDSVTEDDVHSKNNQNESKEKWESSESDIDNEIKSTTMISKSDEEANSSEEIAYSTTETSSNEINEEDNEINSNSNEHEFNFVSLVYQGAGPQGSEQPSLNDHKYSLVNEQAEFQATSAPFMPESASPSTAHARNSVNEYAVIRENLDTQQNYLQKHELNLDKDFYAIITNNYDEESLNKFENDIYVVHENLDRIKRNINAMQNLQSKLYFHKLFTNAVKDAQSKAIN